MDIQKTFKIITAVIIILLGLVTAVDVQAQESMNYPAASGRGIGL